MIMCQQFGIVLTYFIFISTNLSSIGLSLSPHLIVGLVAITQIPLSWIKDISKLSSTNMLANCLIAYGLITVTIYALFRTPENSSDTDDVLPPPPSVIPEVGVSRRLELSPIRPQWYLFIGMSVLLFEGLITLILPLHSACKDAKLKKDFEGILVTVVISIVTFYAVFAVVSWWSFGDDVHVVLTASLPKGNWSRR